MDSVPCRIGDVWEIRTFACFPLFLDSANCGEQVNSHGFRTMGTTLRTYFGRQPCAKLAPTMPHFGPKPDQLQITDRGRKSGLGRLINLEHPFALICGRSVATEGHLCGPIL